MADLDLLRSSENLRRAWRWIRSNPDAAFKSYFRSLYQNYAIAEDALIDDLSDRLRRGIYEPESACKLFHPKASGILRPYSLLTVEDQIVYQAAVNLIAERLFPKVNRRYFKQVFGHLYAGKSSKWFYRKWSDGYRAFNEGARKAFADGYVYAASFDLTACYDSLDHHVLRHFLEKLGHDPEFCASLTGWLEKWTATEQGIFHHHGISQGPLSSGLLSEVVLSHFDSLKVHGVDFHYFRYVDDIRLFAKKEHHLRRLLVALDLLSKDVGLFPQSAKISIHKVKDIEEELKSVSNPPEPVLRPGPAIDSVKLMRRIVALSRKYRITDPTRFKFLLAHATPSAPLTARLWRILENYPEIYQSVCNYLRRYDKLPRVPAQKVVDHIKENGLYQAVRSEFITVADGKLPPAEDAVLAKHLKSLWVPRDLSPDSVVRISHFLIRTGQLTPKQIVYWCAHARSWWARAMLIGELDHSVIGNAPLAELLEAGIRDSATDVSIAASWKAYVSTLIPGGVRRRWNPASEILLKEVGAIQRASAAHCGITKVFAKLDPRIQSLKWKRLFGARYKQAEQQAVESVAASGVNITGFVNVLDVFNDLLLNAVFIKDGTIGGYQLGNIGGALNPGTDFERKLPATYRLAKEVHDARYQSMYSHPLIKRTGKPTRRISYNFLSKARRLLRDAVAELSAQGFA